MSGKKGTSMLNRIAKGPRRSDPVPTSAGVSNHHVIPAGAAAAAQSRDLPNLGDAHDVAGDGVSSSRSDRSRFSGAAAPPAGMTSWAVVAQPRDEKPRRRSRRTEAGFTLTEVMMAILIIGLASTIVLINVLPSRDTAMVEKARADVRALEQALEFYRIDMLDYPTDRQGLDALVSAPDGHPRRDRYREGGYIRRLPEDPWGNPYQYLTPGEHGVVDIYSLGADGDLGGEGLDSDIGNWG